MHAIIKTGGKQYRVAVGQSLKIESLPAAEGTEVIFDQVLMAGAGAEMNIGQPFLKGVQVKAKVLSHGRHKKISTIKMKRRKHHIKHLGHRQNFTEVQITGITA